MVFHSPQAGHRPTHFGLFDPHAWHAYKVLERAVGMPGILAARTDLAFLKPGTLVLQTRPEADWSMSLHRDTAGITSKIVS